MIADIWTVMWKEGKELLLQRGRFRGGLVGLLFFIGVFGIFMPLQSGREWVESPIGLLYWAWVPFLLVSGVIADSFAGERERHTLETLLASRLSDLAILLGKVSAAIAYGWLVTLTSVLLGLITVNLAFGQGQLLLYPPAIALGILALTFLVSWLSSGLGVLVSLRAATVRQAQQTFSIAFFLFFVPLFLIQFLPVGWRAGAARLLMQADLATLAGILLTGLLALDLLLLLAAVAHFKRTRLILEQ
jgi:ABC-2 type transport system permease protein